MAQILVCELDGQAFIERAEDSIAIAQAARYDSKGKAIPFSGDLCPRCGRRLLDVRKELNAMLMEQSAPLPLDMAVPTRTEMPMKSRLGLPPPRDWHDSEGPQDGE